jgi:hypothetical protein
MKKSIFHPAETAECGIEDAIIAATQAVQVSIHMGKLSFDLPVRHGIFQKQSELAYYLVHFFGWERQQLYEK